MAIENHVEAEWGWSRRWIRGLYNFQTSLFEFTNYMTRQKGRISYLNFGYKTLEGDTRLDLGVGSTMEVHLWKNNSCVINLIGPHLKQTSFTVIEQSICDESGNEPAKEERESA